MRPGRIALAIIVFVGLLAAGPASAGPLLDWVVVYWLPGGAGPSDATERLAPVFDAPGLVGVVLQGGADGEMSRTVLRRGQEIREPLTDDDAASLHLHLRWVTRNLDSSRYLLVLPPRFERDPCPAPDEWTPAHGWVYDREGGQAWWRRGLAWDFDLVIVNACPGPDAPEAAVAGLMVPFVRHLSMTLHPDPWAVADRARSQDVVQASALVVSQEGGTAVVAFPSESRGGARPAGPTGAGKQEPIAGRIADRPAWPMTLLALATLGLGVVLLALGWRPGRATVKGDEAEVEARVEALRARVAAGLDDGAREAVRRALRSLEAPLVTAAVDLVVETPVPELLPELRRLPRLTRAGTLAKAGAGLLLTGDQHGERLLLSILPRGEPELVADVIDLLGAAGSGAAVAPMLEHAGRRHRRRVLAAVAAIRERLGEEAIGGLSFEPPEVRAALGRLSVDEPTGDLTLAP